MVKKRITVVFGTRPEAIKLAPLILLLKQQNLVETRVIITGQHKEMTNQVLELFSFQPDLDMNLMKTGQSLTFVTQKVLEGLEKDFSKYLPDLIIVQGDTTSAFSAALAGFYKKIPVAHIEAGLRTNNLMEPFPEELNRRLISQITSLNFAPTQLSTENLRKNDVPGKIFITGNTVIDSLLMISKKCIMPKFKKIVWKEQKVILVSIHRRENWGENINQIALAILEIVDKFSDIAVLLPLHKNSIVREPLKKILGSHSRITLSEPLDYLQMISSLKNCFLVLTDSGGLQEEAPAFGKPVLVLRDTTERQEGILAGTSKIVGTKKINIIKECSNLINDQKKYNLMSEVINPYGDGNASQKIMEICFQHLGI